MKPVLLSCGVHAALDASSAPGDNADITQALHHNALLIILGVCMPLQSLQSFPTVYISTSIRRKGTPLRAGDGGTHRLARTYAVEWGESAQPHIVRSLDLIRY